MKTYLCIGSSLLLCETVVFRTPVGFPDSQHEELGSFDTVPQAYAFLSTLRTRGFRVNMFHRTLHDGRLYAFGFYAVSYIASSS